MDEELTDDPAEAMDTDTEDTGIEIVGWVSGKVIPILKQTPIVRAVLQLANNKMLRSLYFVDALPDGAIKKTGFARTALVDAATELGHAQVLERLKSDKTYVHRLSTAVSAIFDCHGLSYFPFLLAVPAHQQQPWGDQEIFRRRRGDRLQADGHLY